MANYYATARSNYFAVKNERAFREWAKLLGLSILEPCDRDKVGGEVPKYGITPGGDGDGDGWPTSLWSDEIDDYDDIDVSEQLSTHLVDGEVAILMEVGSEKLRYVSGTAIAVNHKGKSIRLDLSTIYESALALGPNITRAEY